MDLLKTCCCKRLDIGWIIALLSCSHWLSVEALWSAASLSPVGFFSVPTATTAASLTHCVVNAVSVDCGVSLYCLLKVT